VRIRDNGDVTLMDKLRIGKFQNNRLTFSPNVINMPNAGPKTIIDYRSAQPPDNGVFLSANGSEISFCPWLGCSQAYDINITAGWVRTKTSRGIENAETNFALDQFVTSGFVPAWKPNTTYAVGDKVLNTINRYLYKATVGGKSAASGSGPTVVGDPIGGTNGPTVTDGSVTWQYIQDADYTDAKTTLNVTTFAGEQAGHTWSSAINTHLGRGAQTDLAVTQELDFFNDRGANCDTVGANCFLNLWFVQGPWTSTSFVQAAGGGESPAIPTDNTSGGAALIGINFTGANTIRNVTFSDGTNAATTLKGYPGTRHVSGFISDESTSTTSYRLGGTNSYAGINDVSTAPFGILQEGTYSGAAYKYKGTLIGAWGGDATFGALSFNNNLAANAINGLFGSPTDPNLYANTVGSYFFRQNGNVILNLAAGRATFAGRLNAPLYTPASSTSACTVGDFADDANFHYVCTATNTWKRAALSKW
jgi:hypothetical protein